MRTLSHLWSLPPIRTGEPRRFTRDDAGLPEGVASGRLALDDRGRLLVPTSRGLAWRDGGVWRRIGRREGLPAEAVLSALVDREGSLWIGLAGAGLAQQLGRGAFASWGSAEGLSHDVVWSIARRPGGGPLWVGTEDGLDRLDLATGEIRVFRVGDGLAGGTVYALAFGPDGSLWAGSWPGGVTRLGPGPGEIRRYGVPGMVAADLKVIALFFDRAGNLWMGARSGAYRLAAGAAARAFEPVRLPGWDDRDSVYGFAELPGDPGTVWAVGRYGLARLTGPAPRRFRQADGLLSDFLSSVVPAAPGEPWDLVAGYREALGAARIAVDGDRLRISPLGPSTGLTFDKVLFLGRDAAGALWVGGGAGVDVFRRGAAAARHYGRAAGLITEDMSQNAFLAELDGTVWLGTSRGLVRYRPGLEPAAPPPPPILLTGATAGSRRLDLARPAVLERDERDLAVSWTAPTFLDPARVRFRYRLAGREEAFHETPAREVRFPALPTGEYRLEVVAVSGAGAASARPAVLALAVRPAWWERPWAWAGGALLLALGLAGAVRLRTRQLEADRRRLETAVAERSAALARAVEELEVASSTDFLTGVHNRRYLYARLDAEVAEALGSYGGAAAGSRGRDLLAYLVDLDFFKAVNDRHGHDRGDRLLVEVARRLQGVIRSGDLLVRWGGEEFLILARGADRAEGGAFARRILAAVGDRPFDLGGGAVLERTCSVGWAPFPWFPGAPGALGLEQVLTLADHALYLAKGEGRDRAVGALPAVPAPGGPEGGAAGVDWWQQPLAEAEEGRVRLVRTERRAGTPVAAGGRER